MSYILDALKKADAARERGQIPGLHSQRTGGPAAASEDRRARRRSVIAITGVVLVLLAAAAGWWWQGLRSEAVTVSVNAPPVSAAAPAPSAEAPPLSAPSPAPVPTVPPAPMVAAAPTVILPILAPELAPLPATTTPPSAAGARAAARSSAVTTNTASVTAPPPAVNNPPAAAVRSFAELAPEVRAQLPQVSVSGSTYSTNPAHRMLIANGQVVREGEEIVPGLKLEGIGPRSAVLNHNGTRYSIGY